MFNIQRIGNPQQHHHHIRVSQEDSSRSRRIGVPVSPEMQFDNIASSHNNSAQLRSSNASQVQQIGEPLSGATHNSHNDSNFSHRADYSLQSLRNNFFENYDNKLIKRQFCEDTIWTLYLISC